MTSPFDLTDRVALVTGAGGGLGGGICRQLGRAGAVAVCVDRDAGGADALASAMGEDGLHAMSMACDVRDREAIASAVDEVIARFGRLDILVNNAAVYPSRPWLEIGDDEWQEVLDVNLAGYFRCAQVLAPHLRESGRGRIVNVASVTFYIGFPNLAHYVSSKGGVIGLTRALARELGPDGVTVNAVAPGAFPTDAERIHPDPEGYNRWVLGQQSLKRRGTPDDVGALATFLASDAASFITGQTIVIDGGWVMH